jgi:predicted MFS family arabinose efflux permease
MSPTSEPHERLVRALAAATFLIFFQAFMVAPLIPRLASEFHVSHESLGSIVPAYLIPYGCTTLAYGVVSDRMGRGPLILSSLLAFSVLTPLTATSQSFAQLFVWRLLTGLAASAVVPLGLVVIGALFPFEKRGRPLGWMFGAMAAGMAFGSTFGAVLDPLIGWRMEFVLVGALGAAGCMALWPHRRSLGPPASTTVLEPSHVARGYVALLKSARGRRTYTYVLLNAMFHSGVFTWLGVYFAHRYKLSETGIGLALLGYGVPGFLFGPALGHAADRWGRGRFIPLGLALAGFSAFALAARLPVAFAAVAVTVLSLGYDITQPMFAGIVTSLGGQRPGQAMGLNVIALFVGFGVGSLAFAALLPLGLSWALVVFAGAELVLALAAVPLFFEERPSVLRPR